MREGNVLFYGFILGLLDWDYSHRNPPTEENTSFVKTMSHLVNITFFQVNYTKLEKKLHFYHALPV